VTGRSGQKVVSGIGTHNAVPAAGFRADDGAEKAIAPRGLIGNGDVIRRGGAVISDRDREYAIKDRHLPVITFGCATIRRGLHDRQMRRAGVARVAFIRDRIQISAARAATGRRLQKAVQQPRHRVITTGIPPCGRRAIFA
jgi:hypothetical protein